MEAASRRDRDRAWFATCSGGQQPRNSRPSTGAASLRWLGGRRLAAVRHVLPLSFVFDSFVVQTSNNSAEPRGFGDTFTRTRKPRRLQRKLDVVSRPFTLRVNDATSVRAARAGSEGRGGPTLRDATDDGPRLKQPPRSGVPMEAASRTGRDRAWFTACSSEQQPRDPRS